MDDTVRRTEFTLRVRELERRLKKIEVTQRGVNYDNLERGLFIALKAVKTLLSLGSEGIRSDSGLIKERNYAFDKAPFLTFSGSTRINRDNASSGLRG